MRYLATFNHRLRALREQQCLSEGDIAYLCQVDEQLVRRWESIDSALRCFPNIDQLVTLCYRTRTPLEQLLALDGVCIDGQLELPGLAPDGSDLGSVVDELQREVSIRLPHAQERKLLDRFRAADPESQRLILQLLL